VRSSFDNAIHSSAEVLQANKVVTRLIPNRILADNADVGAFVQSDHFGTRHPSRPDDSNDAHKGLDDGRFHGVAP
jgi:hypothetical protein